MAIAPKVHALPDHLAREVEEAQEYMAEAEARMNGAQHSVALWHCSEGRHVFGHYTKPPIGRACIYCRAPDSV